MPIFIEDVEHSEIIEECDSFKEAIARLDELAKLPWDHVPNRCPCVEWRTCGRQYRVIEFDDSTTPWKPIRAADVLNMSASGIEWIPGFEYAWAEPWSE